MSQKLKQPYKIRVPMEELEDSPINSTGYEMYNHKGQPFSGYLVMDYHPNGNIMYEEEYRNGEHMGFDNEYFENGDLKRETLMLGATTIEYIEYDINNKRIHGGLSVSASSYKALVEKYNLLD